MENEEKTTEKALAQLTEAEHEQVREIAPGMTVEEIRAVYFNSDALKEPPYRVFQLNSDGHRYYYRFNENGEPEFFPSVTTLLKQVMPTPPALLDWMVANGKDGATEKRDLAAAYGTFMHIQFETLLINRRYDFDNVPAVLLEYMERENLPERVFSEWIVKIRKDVLAFAQFVKDYNVKPLAVEIGLVHPEHRYAGCLDLPCVMTDPKTAETFRAIVDFKSGRKGFFEEHELQLHLYREMWNVNYPDAPVERLFNFSPKDWRKAPSYNLKEQTGSVNAKKLPHLLALATIEDEKRDNTLTIVRGVLDLDHGKIADNILSLSLAELIKGKSEKKEAPENTDATKGLNATIDPYTDAPVEATKKPAKRTKSAGKGKTTEKDEKPVETKNEEKQLIRAGGPLTAYDICELYCKEKNCDYCLGTHEPKCEQAMERAGRKYDDPDLFPTKDEKLPWENDAPEQEPAKPAGPTPEQLATDNLLNAEMEL